MKWLSILLGIIAVVLIGVAVFFMTQKTSPTPGGTVTNITNPFGPTAGSVPVATTTTNESPVINLKLIDGTVATVPDFTKANQPATANAENGYQVAGSSNGDFHITYYPLNWGILISLYTEPLGSVRLTAENALRTVLGLSDSQLCKLTIDVRTTVDVSNAYAGRNLGLSFCPGAVKLPQ